MMFSYVFFQVFSWGSWGESGHNIYRDALIIFGLFSFRRCLLDGGEVSNPPKLQTELVVWLVFPHFSICQLPVSFLVRIFMLSDEYLGGCSKSVFTLRLCFWIADTVVFFHFEKDAENFCNELMGFFLHIKTNGDLYKLKSY